MLLSLGIQNYDFSSTYDVHNKNQNKHEIKNNIRRSNGYLKLSFFPSNAGFSVKAQPTSLCQLYSFILFLLLGGYLLTLFLPLESVLSSSTSFPIIDFLGFSFGFSTLGLSGVSTNSIRKNCRSYLWFEFHHSSLTLYYGHNHALILIL